MSLALSTWLVVVASQAPESPKAAEIHGTWRLVSVEAAAGAMALPEDRPLLTITDRELLVAGEPVGRLSADAATDPKVFDLHIAMPEQTYEGIYRLIDRNKLEVCLNGRTEGTKERPNSFSLTDQPIRRLLTLERAKPDETPPGGGYLGMALRFDDAAGLVVVQATLDGSPANKAGLKPDDVVLTVGGSAVSDLASAIAAVRRAKPRTELALHIRRQGEERDIQITVGVVPFAVLTGLDS